MKTLDVKNLESREEMRDVLHHLKELMRSQENIGALLARLNEFYGKNPEEAAACLTDLEVEAIDHTGYHVRQLSKPLRKLVTKVYNTLDDDT